MQCHGCRVPVRNRNPQISDASPKAAHDTWMMRRQSKRSASPPNGIEKNRCGSQWLITANPASSGEWKVCHITK